MKYQKILFVFTLLKESSGANQEDRMENGGKRTLIQGHMEMGKQLFSDIEKQS